MKDKKCNVEVFSRVTGFFRPVQSWNKGKAEEFRQRKTFDVEKAAKEADGHSRAAKTVTR